MILLLSACAPIQENIKSWNTVDTARQFAFTGALIADWSLTDYTAQHPESRSEINPILGKHPTREAVAWYFAGCGIGHAAVSVVLPQKITRDKKPVKLFGIEINPRAIWQYVWIGTEGVFIGYSLYN